MEIELCGYKMLIDDEDYEKVVNIRWRINHKDLRLHGKYYFRNDYTGTDNKQHTVLLHRLLTGLQLHDGFECDHINGNTLDNRKCNLRKCNKTENNRNSKKRKKNKTGYKGVSAIKGSNKYVAQIFYNNKCIYLGSYKTPQEAHAAYCEASKKYHGEFGRTE